MTLQSGGNFGLGAATAGEIGLNLFQKSPDPKRKTNSAKSQLRSKSNSFFKAKNHTLRVPEQTTRLKLIWTKQSKKRAINFKRRDKLKDAELSTVDPNK